MQHCNHQLYMAADSKRTHIAKNHVIPCLSLLYLYNLARKLNNGQYNLWSAFEIIFAEGLLVRCENARDVCEAGSCL